MAAIVIVGAAEVQAAKAEAPGDVQAMVASVFALYSLEVAARVKDPKASGLIEKAAAAVLAKKDAKAAALFLETAGPLTGGLNRETREKVTELAIGKTIPAAAKEGAERSRGAAEKVGPDLANPEVKARGYDLAAFATAVGKEMVLAAHPSGVGPRLSSQTMKGDTLYIRMAWKGGILGTPYTSTIELTFTRRAGGVQVTSWDYDDDCAAPKNMVFVRAYIAELNRSLAK